MSMAEKFVSKLMTARDRQLGAGFRVVGSGLANSVAVSVVAQECGYLLLQFSDGSRAAISDHAVSVSNQTQ